MSRVVFVILAICSCIAAASDAWGAGPKITKMSPTKASVDQTIKLFGENLSKTRSVVFLVGQTHRSAKFHAVSNTEINVVVPEFYRANAEALVILETDRGMTITCPVTEFVVRENQPTVIHDKHPTSKAQFIHVINGGVVKNSSLVTAIEDGGFVSSVDDHCPIVLIKKGGVLGTVRDHSSSSASFIFHEPGARIAEFANSKHHWNVVPVAEINLSEGIGPFVFQPISTDAAGPEAVTPPEIMAVNPVIATAGDVVILRGKGFLGTTEVYVVAGPVKAAGFHIVSDTILKVETPDGYASGHSEFIVINSKGMALTRSPEALNTPAQRTLGPRFIHVARGMLLTANDTRAMNPWAIYFVEEGATLSNPHGSALVVVKNGGTVDAVSSRLFHEPSASVPVGGTRGVQVPSIRLCPLQTGLEFVGPNSR